MKNKYLTLKKKQEKSGLKIIDFLKREGIAQSTFYKWKKDYEKTNQNPFIELTETSLGHIIEKDTIILKSNNITIELSDNFNKNLLKKIVEVLND